MKDDVLAYAREVKRQLPQITDEELRAFLKARFFEGKDPRAGLAAACPPLGAVANPLDWIWGLAAILRGIGKLWSTQDASGVMDIIEGVIIIVQEPAPAQT